MRKDAGCNWVEFGKLGSNYLIYSVQLSLIQTHYLQITQNEFDLLQCLHVHLSMYLLVGLVFLFYYNIFDIDT